MMAMPHSLGSSLLSGLGALSWLRLLLARLRLRVQVSQYHFLAEPTKVVLQSMHGWANLNMSLAAEVFGEDSFDAVCFGGHGFLVLYDVEVFIV